MEDGSNTDKEFVKLLGTHILNAKGFYEYGIKRGLTTPEDMKLTIAARQKEAKKLVDGGMSQRQAAKVLGVDQKTICNDLRKSSSNGEEKSRTPTTRKPRIAEPADESEKPAASDPVQESCDDCETPEQHWQRSLGNLAGDAISMRSFWTREFGQWENFKVPSSLVKLAKQAARTWVELAAIITKNEGD